MRLSRSNARGTEHDISFLAISGLFPHLVNSCEIEGHITFIVSRSSTGFMVNKSEMCLFSDNLQLFLCRFESRLIVV